MNSDPKWTLMSPKNFSKVFVSQNVKIPFITKICLQKILNVHNKCVLCAAYFPSFIQNLPIWLPFFSPQESKNYPVSIPKWLFALTGEILWKSCKSTYPSSPLLSSSSSYYLHKYNVSYNICVVTPPHKKRLRISHMSTHFV